MPSSLLVRVVFGLLVIATTGAFFISQRLKRSPPPIDKIYYRDVLSPNGDGRFESVGLRFRLRRADDVTVSMLDARGEEVRRLTDGRRLRAGLHRLRWDGRDDDGRVVPDGPYSMRVTLLSEGRSVSAPRTTRVDTRPPRPRLIGAAPGTLVPGTAQAGTGVEVRYTAPRASSAPLFRVLRTDDGPAREVDRFRGKRFGRAVRWDARIGGRLAPDGVYAFTVTVRDKARNAGTAPRAGVARASDAAPRTGVTVVRSSVSGPLEPVVAGRGARFRLTGPPRRYRWSMGRLEGGRALGRGRGFGRDMLVRVPRRARTGVLLLRVRSGAGRAVFPVPVRRPAPNRRVLLVLPAISWQGRNPVDDDRDGFVDTLDVSGAIRLSRPFAGGRLPPGFSAGTGPLLRVLGETRERYELTTDLALARRRGPGLSGRPGVIFAGDERWLPKNLGTRLREYAAGGGRVVSLGTDAFHRTVALERDRLTRPGPRARADVFGERTALLRVEPGALTVFSDRLGLFRGTGGALGSFGLLEESRGLPPGAEALAAAGLDPERPSFVAYRLGKGTVVRAGLPAFGREARDQPEIGRLARALTRFASR